MLHTGTWEVSMAMLAVNQCEDCELVATAGSDAPRKQASGHIRYPQKGFGVFRQIMDTRHNIGGGGIFTRQCLDWCKARFKDAHFDRIIIFSDSQDMDYHYNKSLLPEPFGTCNYICDVSAHTRGVNYRGRYTAGISGWSEHYLLQYYI